MPSKEDLKSWKETQELIRKMNILLYGFDISKLSVKEQQFVKEMTKQRWELEAEAEKRNPKPKKKLSVKDQLEIRRIELQLAKIEKELEELDRDKFNKGGA